MTAVYNAQKTQIEDQELAKHDLVAESRKLSYAHTLLQKQHTMMVEKVQQHEAEIKRQKNIAHRLTNNNKKLYEQLTNAGANVGLLKWDESSSSESNLSRS